MLLFQYMAILMWKIMLLLEVDCHLIMSHVDNKQQTTWCIFFYQHTPPPFQGHMKEFHIFTTKIHHHHGLNLSKIYILGGHHHLRKVRGAKDLGK